MSERSLATFLQTLLTSAPAPAGPVRDPVALQRLATSPSPPFQHLLAAHLDAFLRDVPAGETLRPQAVPAGVLGVGAALNNLALSATYPDPRLLTITLRLLDELPPVTTTDAALAAHSLLRHLPRIRYRTDWEPVRHRLLAASPLTALWLPHPGDTINWDLALALLARPPLRVLVRDRLLGLLPPPERFPNERIETAVARANEDTGRLLAALLEHGGAAWQPFVLALYPAPQHASAGLRAQPGLEPTACNTRL